MACLVAMALSLPLSASHDYFTKETPPRITVLFRVSSQQTLRTAVRYPVACTTNVCGSPLNRRCQDHLPGPSKSHFEIIPSGMNAESCSQIIILGYWVGPDVDDGWGYVEAFVSVT